MYENAANHKYVDLEKLLINPDAACLIPKETALQYCAIAFAVKDNRICVAMKAPDDLEATAYLRMVCRKEIIPFKAGEECILSSIKNYYEKVNAEKAVEDLQTKLKASNDIRRFSSAGIKASDNAPAVKLTDYIINGAIMKRASDIHIEPFDDIVFIRYRTDGVLFEVFNMPLDIYGAVAARIKIMGNMDISEKRSPQDGKVEYIFAEKAYDLRISSLPTIHGEKFVIRILYKSSEFASLKSINFTVREMQLITKALKNSHGMILVTGPTGSGKSTTLYAMINELNNREKNITTIEDPVEYSVKGINQVNVNPKAKVTFATGLRSILRQDPDVILVGEVRDEETAAIAVRAAITGHLVISTLHTNDAAGAIPRLIEMGVEKYLLADSLIAVIAQRLIRRICEFCKTEYTPSDSEKRNLGITDERKLYKGKGCIKCGKSGYSGRRAVCEVLYIDSIQRERMLKLDSVKDVSWYSSNNMRFIADNVKELVLEGVTTYEEMLKLANGKIDVE